MSLAPFKKGELVIALADFPHYKNKGFNTPIIGEVYTVRNIKIMRGDSGYSWFMTLEEISNTPITYDGKTDEIHWLFKCFTRFEINSIEEEVEEEVEIYN